MLNQPLPRRLPRILSPLVILPATIVGILLNLQVKRLGEKWPDLAGGTPIYITRLFSPDPWLGHYPAVCINSG